MKFKGMLLSAILAAVLCFSGNLLAVCPSMDVTNDCFVDLEDFAVFASQWLTSTGIPDTVVEDFETGDFSQHPWSHSGNAGWMINSSMTFEGMYAARPRAITHNQTSTLEITFNTPLKAISFYRKVSSQENSDYLRFYIDGVLIASWSGEQDWNRQTYTITPGTHTFRWSYIKDGSGDNRYDSAWIDNVTLYNPVTVSIPDVAGQTRAQAKPALAAAGLVVGTATEVFSTTAAAGSIISQTPSAGQTALIGSAVNLVVSSGPDIVWVQISDPGVAGHEGFNGYMSKYETTNAQYCKFLNDARVSDNISVSGNAVMNGVGKVYYYLNGSGNTYNGATLGGASRIRFIGSQFTVDSGFENHPVTYVIWDGATAFCNYYGRRLPSEWEWQAVADFDGTYTYGYGASTDHSKANYYGSIHPDGTTAVGAFGCYGYGMADMSGNVCEWTSSGNVYFAFRGGGWSESSSLCYVSSRYASYDTPQYWYSCLGFRACRDARIAIADSGAGMKDGNGNPISHGGFTGEMSTYETTNAQYAQFLTAALATGDIYVDGIYVKGANGSNSGGDFAGQIYYNIEGAGYTGNGAVNGGASRINYSGGQFTVDSGFENHPVTYVSWYGSTAFCNYYGWRLPTEWEWQAVADYDGTYAYGSGIGINNSMANYDVPAPSTGTTAVAAFGAYGYGMADMAGNVWEWTSTVSGSNRVIRGGGWGNPNIYCTVSCRFDYGPETMGYSRGFRVCR
jgi:formylglycine-generating enzyme required for sulfatase activity